jgi:hypothetical protein
MNTVLLAAAAALSLGVGSAFAADSQGQAGGYAYPDYVFPGSGNAGVQQAPVQTQQSGQAIHTFVTRSAHQGTYLFPPAQGDNGQPISSQALRRKGRHHCRPFVLAALSPQTQPRDLCRGYFARW